MVTVQKSCAPLKKGEYVKAYFAKTYDITTVKQQKSIHEYGWKQESVGGAYVPVNEWRYETSYVFSRKALFPQFKFEYFSSARSAEPIRTEIYEFIDGTYQLIESE